MTQEDLILWTKWCDRPPPRQNMVEEEDEEEETKSALIKSVAVVYFARCRPLKRIRTGEDLAMEAWPSSNSTSSSPALG
jgi:hypothetical protein